MSDTKVPAAIQSMVDRLEDGFARGAEGYTDVIGHIATLTPELTKHVPISVVARKDGTTYNVQITAFFTIDLAEWTDPFPGRAPGDTGNAAAYVAMGRDEAFEIADIERVEYEEAVEYERQRRAAENGATHD